MKDPEALPRKSHAPLLPIAHTNAPSNPTPTLTNPPPKYEPHTNYTIASIFTFTLGLAALGFTLMLILADRPFMPPNLSWGYFFAPSFICLMTFCFCRFWWYDPASINAGRRLGFVHPHERGFPHGLFGDRVDVRKECERDYGGYKFNLVSVSWVDGEEAKRFVRGVREAEPRCEVSGELWEERPNTEDEKASLGRKWEEIDVQRWEDTTEEEVFVNFDNIVDNAPFDVLKVTITLSCTHTKKLKKSVGNFMDNFPAKSYTTDPPPLPRAYTTDPPPQPKRWTDNVKIITTVPDAYPPLFPPRQNWLGRKAVRDEHKYIEEKILFVYRNKRPWWAEERWFKLWRMVNLGGFWELWVGRGYRVLEKEVVIRKALF
ncbi:hypothetical protein HDV00_002572 [Rhizophlyctis rosea]|nr:hypothetical protein HDV00_002572 [Rhizophlyctis rosea]